MRALDTKNGKTPREEIEGVTRRQKGRPRSGIDRVMVSVAAADVQRPPTDWTHSPRFQCHSSQRDNPETHAEAEETPGSQTILSKSKTRGRRHTPDF